VASLQLLSGGSPVDDRHVTGAVDVIANIYDTPPLTPPKPWDLARLAPASIWWDLVNSTGAVVEVGLTVNFD